MRDVIEGALGATRNIAEMRLSERQRDLDEARRRTTPTASQHVLKERARAIDDARAWAAQFTGISTAAPRRVEPQKTENGTIGGVARGVSVWAWFEGKEKPVVAKIRDGGAVEYKWREGKAQPGAWRIAEFLGCQEPIWQDARSWPNLGEGRRPPRVLVIDDLGLGFTQHRNCWPSCLTDTAKSPTHIVVKATAPFDNLLWQQLLPRWAERTMVVVSAAALRDRGARLSRGLSWDQTIEEVKAEFLPGGVCWPLRECQRVVVLFGRSGAAVFGRTARSRTEALHQPPVPHFERFVFDPAHLEDTWGLDGPGTTFGTASAMTALLAVETLMQPPPSTHITISRGLAAARALHEVGGGHDEKALDLDAAARKLFEIDPGQGPEAIFRSAFPRDLLDPPLMSGAERVPPPKDQTLLTDVVGLTSSFLIVAAEDIVRFGKDRALRSVPRLECGKYFTVDREEIERLNAVRNVILDYTHNRGDTRPLSLAVFGPPGSGKSFAIKQLSEQLFGRDRAVLEFNLSQFVDLDDLHEAFHEVRDKSVAGQIPFVFWDEFDCAPEETKLRWLKEFLAPMQDSHFVSKGKPHPFAKCVFIFAGGTAATFAEFDRSGRNDEVFNNAKGPDFVSRLRGYVNIKGPNPTQDHGDEVYLIRRALLLRSLIEKHHPDIVQPTRDKEVVISPTVLNALLRVGGGRKGSGYVHGARSMENLITLSRLHGSRHFGPSELPSREVAQLHVTADFFETVEDNSRYHLSPDDTNCVAAIIHRRWVGSKRGYVYGPSRDDHSTPKTHPLLVDYEALSEHDKENNRLPARLTALRLAALGYDIVPADQAKGNIVESLARPELRALAISEHRRWMRQKLLAGYAFGEVTNDALLLHNDLCRWADLPAKERKIDSAIIDGLFEFLRGRRLVLVKRTPSAGRRKTRR